MPHAFAVIRAFTLNFIRTPSCTASVSDAAGGEDFTKECVTLKMAYMRGAILGINEEGPCVRMVLNAETSSSPIGDFSVLVRSIHGVYMTLTHHTLNA